MPMMRETRNARLVFLRCGASGDCWAWRGVLPRAPTRHLVAYKARLASVPEGCYATVAIHLHASTLAEPGK
jgi:hypothetical protein